MYQPNGVFYIWKHIQKENYRGRSRLYLSKRHPEYGDALPSNVNYYSPIGKGTSSVGTDIGGCSQWSSSILDFRQDKPHCGDGCWFVGKYGRQQKGKSGHCNHNRVQRKATNRREGTKTKGRQVRNSLFLGPGGRTMVKHQFSLLLYPRSLLPPLN